MTRCVYEKQVVFFFANNQSRKGKAHDRHRHSLHTNGEPSSPLREARRPHHRTSSPRTRMLLDALAEIIPSQFARVSTSRIMRKAVFYKQARVSAIDSCGTTSPRNQKNLGAPKTRNSVNRGVGAEPPFSATYGTTCVAIFEPGSCNRFSGNSTCASPLPSRIPILPASGPDAAHRRHCAEASTRRSSQKKKKNSSPRPRPSRRHQKSSPPNNRPAQLSAQ